MQQYRSVSTSPLRRRRSLMHRYVVPQSVKDARGPPPGQALEPRHHRRRPHRAVRGRHAELLRGRGFSARSAGGARDRAEHQSHGQGDARRRRHGGLGADHVGRSARVLGQPSTDTCSRRSVPDTRLAGSTRRRRASSSFPTLEPLADRPAGQKDQVQRVHRRLVRYRRAAQEPRHRHPARHRHSDQRLLRVRPRATP